MHVTFSSAIPAHFLVTWNWLLHLSYDKMETVSIWREIIYHFFFPNDLKEHRMIKNTPLNPGQYSKQIDSDSVVTDGIWQNHMNTTLQNHRYYKIIGLVVLHWLVSFWRFIWLQYFISNKFDLFASYTELKGPCS